MHTQQLHLSLSLSHSLSLIIQLWCNKICLEWIFNFDLFRGM